MSRKTSRWTLIMVLCLSMVVGFTLGASASSYRLDALGNMLGIVDDEIDALYNPALFAAVERPQGAVEFMNNDSRSKTEDLVAKTTDTPSNGEINLDTYFAMPLGFGGMKNVVAAQLIYDSIYWHDVHPTSKYDSSHPSITLGAYDGLQLNEQLAVGFGFNMALAHKRQATNTSINTTYIEEWKYPVNTLVAGSTYQIDEKTQLSAQGSYLTGSGDYLYTSQVTGNPVSTLTDQKNNISNMGMQAKVKRELGEDLTAIGFGGFDSGTSGYTPKGSTVKNETKTSNFKLGAGVVKKFESALVVAKAEYTSDGTTFTDEPAYIASYPFKKSTISAFTAGVGSEMTVMKGLVARAGIWDTFQSTTSIVRADNSTVKSGGSNLLEAKTGLGYTFGNYQVDLLVPIFSTSSTENSVTKTSSSDRTIWLSVSTKF